MHNRRRAFPRNSRWATSVSFSLLLNVLTLGSPGVYAQTAPRSAEYDAVQKRLASGWNTWDLHSVTTHVLLPTGLAIGMSVHCKTALNGEAFLTDALTGRPGQNTEQVFPGAHAWDGSYTELRLAWRGIELQIQSAHAGRNLVILVSPLPSEQHRGFPVTVVFSAAYLWNRPGTVARVDDRIEAQGPSGKVDIYSVGAEAPFSNIPVAGPYLSADLTDAVAVSTGKRRTLEEIRRILDEQRAAYERSLGPGRSATVDAIQTSARTVGRTTAFMIVASGLSLARLSTNDSAREVSPTHAKIRAPSSFA